MSPRPPDLDDAATMAVYADALVERGDPRGELIQLHLASEERSDAKLDLAIDQCLARNDRHLLGPLRTATSVCDFRWRRGFIVEARLYSRSSENEGSRIFYPRDTRSARNASPNAPRLPRIVRQLLAVESAQPLQSLSLSMPFSATAREHLLWCVDEVVRARHPSLRVVNLVMTVFDGRGDEVQPRASFAAALGQLRVCTCADLRQHVPQRLR